MFSYMASEKFNVFFSNCTFSYMFWTDWGVLPRIERASMDGSDVSRTVLVDTNIEWPNGLTLDYVNKRLFWVDAKLHQIFSVDWNGQDRRKIRIEPKALPQPFSISYFDSTLYWSDWKTR